MPGMCMLDGEVGWWRAPVCTVTTNGTVTGNGANAAILADPYGAQATSTVAEGTCERVDSTVRGQ